MNSSPSPYDQAYYSKVELTSALVNFFARNLRPIHCTKIKSGTKTIRLKTDVVRALEIPPAIKAGSPVP